MYYSKIINVTLHLRAQRYFCYTILHFLHRNLLHQSSWDTFSVNLFLTLRNLFKEVKQSMNDTPLLIFTSCSSRELVNQTITTVIKRRRYWWHFSKSKQRWHLFRENTDSSSFSGKKETSADRNSEIMSPAEVFSGALIWWTTVSSSASQAGATQTHLSW